MGKRSSTDSEVAFAVNTGAFSAVGVGTSKSFVKFFNLTIWGTFSATAQLERSFDGGVVWHPCTDNAGNIQLFTKPLTIILDEHEEAVLYRLNCTTYTSGTMNWRISQ